MATEALKIHEIVKYPDPVLMKKCAPVTVFDAALRTLVDGDVREHVCGAGDRAGGAADRHPEAADGDRCQLQENPKDKLVLINPEVVETKGKQMEEEGCLSLPEIREKVARAAWVKVRAQNEHGEWFEVEGEELLARAILHEIDHLNGVLFIDRISRLKRELVLRKIQKMQKNGEW